MSAVSSTFRAHFTEHSMLADGDAPRYYAMFGADFSTLHRQCATPALVSDDLTNPDSFDNYEWIHSVYRDGNVIHALVHNGFSPAVVVWAWLIYTKAAKSWSVSLMFSLLSLILATVSSLLAVLFLLHAPKVKGIWIFDPWANFLSNGVLTSLVAIALAFCGLWKRNPIRWPALLCAVVGFPFWFGVGGSA
jgi:hypothetical protein